MLVSSKPLAQIVNEGECPDCDGSGTQQVYPHDSTIPPFEIGCSTCNGEKIITKDLLERKALGHKLTELMIESRLTVRAASIKFNRGTLAAFREWNDAKQGRRPLAEIQRKIDLVVKEMAAL